jgi:hypothetical protein
VGRLVKCPYCQEQLDKDEAILHNKRYYHEHCFKIWQQEKEHYKELIAYICELYRINEPTGMIYKQIKSFKEISHYKYKGMELALRYFHETLNNPVKEDTGIGIISYVYEEAKKHYLMKLQVEKSVENNKDLHIQNKVITVDSPPFTYKKKTKKIDIGSL